MSLFDFILIMLGLGLVAVALLYFYIEYRYKHPRYRVQFVRLMNGTPLFIGRKKLAKMPEVLTWKKNVIKMNWNLPLYRIRSENVYVYDVDSGQMFTEAQKDGIDPKLNKAIFKDHLAQQLTTAATKRSMFDITIIGMVVLVALGLVVGIVIAQNLIG